MIRSREIYLLISKLKIFFESTPSEEKKCSYFLYSPRLCRAAATPK